MKAALLCKLIANSPLSHTTRLKRFSALLLCLLLAVTFCACTSSSPAASSEAPVTSLPASSAEKLSSALPASSEAAEKLELEIDRTLGLDTISTGQYINQQGKLIVDRKYFDTICPDEFTKDEYYTRQYSLLDISENTANISTAIDANWSAFLINGKIHLTDSYNACQSVDLQKDWDNARKKEKAYYAAFPDVKSVFTLSGPSGNLIAGAVLPDHSVRSIGSENDALFDRSLSGWNVVSACYYGTAADGGILGLKPDGRFCFEPVSGEPDSDFSKISNVAAFSGNPFQYITQEGGFITCLLNDGTLIVTDGEAKYTAAQNVVKIDTSAQIYITSDNSVYSNNQKIGSVSDWHNVAYLKRLNGDTVVAAMKNGTVEVVSPGDASKTLLDFLASIKDLKVAWE